VVRSRDRRSDVCVCVCVCVLEEHGCVLGVCVVYTHMCIQICWLE